LLPLVANNPNGRSDRRADSVNFQRTAALRSISSIAHEIVIRPHWVNFCLMGISKADAGLNVFYADIITGRNRPQVAIDYFIPKRTIGCSIGMLLAFRGLAASKI
jgi:hypothetical protein